MCLWSYMLNTQSFKIISFAYENFTCMISLEVSKEWMFAEWSINKGICSLSWVHLSEQVFKERDRSFLSILCFIFQQIWFFIIEMLKVGKTVCENDSKQ